MLIHNEISSNEISSYAQGALRYYNIAIGTSDNYDYVVQCFMYQMAFDIMAIEANNHVQIGQGTSNTTSTLMSSITSSITSSIMPL